MDTKYSKQYAELRQFVKSEPISNELWNAIIQFNSKLKDRDIFIIIFGVIFTLSVLCFVIGIIFIFLPFKKLTWLSFILGISFLVLSFLIVSVSSDIEDKSRMFDDLKKADEIFLERKRSCHVAVAGYYYYSAYKQGSKLAKKRFDKLLKMPELLYYFNENGLMKTDEILGHLHRHLTWRNKYADEYREIVTNHYRERMKKPINYKLFYESNIIMFDSQIENYDCNFTVKTEGDLYSLVSHYHYNWCNGDEKSREMFVKNFHIDEVLEGYNDEMEKKSGFHKNNPHIHVLYTDESFALANIIEKVSSGEFNIILPDEYENNF